MFLGGLFMIYLLPKDYYFYNMSSRKRSAYCEAVDDAILKGLGTMLWVSMPESVTDKCYGCSRVTDEKGRPKFFGSQRDHDVCCMMTPDEQVDYISEDVIHKILTTLALAEELWKRVEVELNQPDRKRLRQMLNNTEPKDRTVDEDWARKNLDRITDYTKFLLKTLSSAEHDKESSFLKRKRDVDSD